MILVMGLLVSTNANSLSKEKMAKLVSKAKTQAAVHLIHEYCRSEDSFLETFYSERCKCAIKSGKAETKAAVFIIADQCGM